MAYKLIKKEFIHAQKRAKTEQDESFNEFFPKDYQIDQKYEIKLANQFYHRSRRQSASNPNGRNQLLGSPTQNRKKNQIQAKLELPKIQKGEGKKKSQAFYSSNMQAINKNKIPDHEFFDLKQLNEDDIPKDDSLLKTPPIKNHQKQDEKSLRFNIRSEQKKKRNHKLAPIVLQSYLIKRQNKFLKICRNKIYSMQPKEELGFENITFFPNSNKKGNFVI